MIEAEASVAVASGVGVSVGGGRCVGVNAADVSVKRASTVLAAEVRTAATSGVGSGAEEAPQAESNNVKVDARVVKRKIFDFTEPPLLLAFIFYFNVERENCSKIIAGVISHTPVPLVWSGATGCYQVERDVDCFSASHKAIAFFEFEIVCIYCIPHFESA